MLAQSELKKYKVLYSEMELYNDKHDYLIRDFVFFEMHYSIYKLKHFGMIVEHGTNVIFDI